MFQIYVQNSAGYDPDSYLLYLENIEEAIQLAKVIITRHAGVVHEELNLSHKQIFVGHYIVEGEKNEVWVIYIE